MNIATKEGMAAAVAWQTLMVSLIAEGGVWMVPRSLTMVKIYASKKTAVFVGGTDMEPDIVKVFKAMGWTCQDRETPPDVQTFSE